MEESKSKPAAGLLSALRGAKTHLGFVSTLRTIVGCRDQEYAGELFDGLAELLPKLDGITQALVSDAMYRMIWANRPGPCPNLPGVSVSPAPNPEPEHGGDLFDDAAARVEEIEEVMREDRDPVRFDRAAPVGPAMYGIDEEDYLTGDGLDGDDDDDDDDDGDDVGEGDEDDDE